MDARRVVPFRSEKDEVPWVFPRPDGEPIGTMGKAWATACRKAKCPGRLPHDLRHTAVRALVRAGIPEKVCMELTGHNTRSVFERDNIVSDSDLRTAVRKLDVSARVPRAEGGSR